MHNHRGMTKIVFDYPYIKGTFEDGRSFQYDVVETYVPKRPEYKELLDKDFFNSGVLRYNFIQWSDDIDMLCDEIYEEGEEIMATEEGYTYFPEIVDVEFLDDLILIASFINGVKKKYDCHRILSHHEQCKQLLDNDFFKKGECNTYSINWSDWVDVDGYDVWWNGEVIE